MVDSKIINLPLGSLSNPEYVCTFLHSIQLALLSEGPDLEGHTFHISDNLVETPQCPDCDTPSAELITYYREDCSFIISQPATCYSIISNFLLVC